MHHGFAKTCFKGLVQVDYFSGYRLVHKKVNA